MIDHFLEDAIEVDVDALCDARRRCDRRDHAAHRRGRHSLRRLVVRAAGGRAYRAERLETIRDYTRKLAMALKVLGLVNIQFAIQRAQTGRISVYVIEVNPRASRTVPYVSKATGIPLAKIASRIMVGQKAARAAAEQVARARTWRRGRTSIVKSPVFPWGKFPGVDTVLGPEMKSTGEVMGVADNFGEAFAKAQIVGGTGACRTRARCFFSVNDHDKQALFRWRAHFVEMGFHIVATHGTADVLERRG